MKEILRFAACAHKQHYLNTCFYKIQIKISLRRIALRIHAAHIVSRHLAHANLVPRVHVSLDQRSEKVSTFPVPPDKDNAGSGNEIVRALSDAKQYAPHGCAVQFSGINLNELGLRLS